MYCFLPAQNLKILARAIHSLSRLPGEDLYTEASEEGLSIRTVNSSQSGYMSFLFKPTFFVQWAPSQSRNENRREDKRDKSDRDRTSENYCKISMKSALIFYKNVMMLEKSIESCSISIDVDEWRLVFELQCKSGVIHKYKLVLLNCARMHASFDKATTNNVIATPGKLFVDGMQQNFHSNQEEVTMSVDANELQFRNYIDDTPQPAKVLKTQLRLERSEFEQYRVQSDAEITFCLKELRAVLGFVEVYQLPVVVRFDEPGKPIIFSLESDPAFNVDLLLSTFVEAEPSQRRASFREASFIGTEPSQRRASLRGTSPIRAEPSQRRVSPREALVDGAEPLRTVENRTPVTALELEPPQISQNQLQRIPDDHPPPVVESQAPQLSAGGPDAELVMDVTQVSSDPESQQTDPGQRGSTKSGQSAYPILFRNWSQASNDPCSQQTDHGSDTSSRVILAPDSDLEDY